MRKKYEKRVDELKNQSLILKRDNFILKAEKEKDIEEYRQSKQHLGERLVQLKFKYDDLLTKERNRDAQEDLNLMN